MRRTHIKKLAIIMIIMLLSSMFAACANNAPKQEKDPLVSFKTQVLDTDPDITDSTITIAGEDTIILTIVVKDIATDDFATDISKTHAQQLRKKFPDKVVKLKVVKGGNTIGDFTIDS